MTSVIIELCSSREDAEARKQAIRANDPTQEYDSRIIEDVTTASLTELTSTEPGAPIGTTCRAFASNIGVEAGSLLFMWAVTD